MNATIVGVICDIEPVLAENNRLSSRRVAENGNWKTRSVRRASLEKGDSRGLRGEGAQEAEASEPLKDTNGRGADHLIHQGPRRGLLDTPGLIGSAAFSRYLLRERAKILILFGNDIVLLAQVRGRQLDKLRRGFHT